MTVMSVGHWPRIPIEHNAGYPTMMLTPLAMNSAADHERCESMRISYALIFRAPCNASKNACSSTGQVPRAVSKWPIDLSAYVVATMHRAE